MSTPRTQRGDDSSPLHLPLTPSRHDATASQHTYASFSPATLSSTGPSTTSAAKRRSTILVHQKSPLLLATPPQITRALAYSHPFLLPLNKLVGLLTWTTDDSWESFLLLAAFWAAALYGDVVIRAAGPLVLVLVLVAGMYGRRFSPLSSSGWSEPGLGHADGTALAADAKGSKSARRSKNLSVDGLPDKNGKAANGSAGTGGGGGHTRNQGSISEVTNTRHQKTLDEIVENLREFTARCNILLEPLLELTDFLSTQRTPTSATTRPALTTLFVRILFCIPVWFLLTLPPLRIITTRRVILILGTILLSWHARVIRVTRAILWRSATIRWTLALVTGLQFESVVKTQSTTPSAATGSAASSAASKKNTTSSAKSAAKTARESELTKALRRHGGGRGRGTGVRFTFIIYENQRRWIGLGWLHAVFSYDRPAWADERNNAVPSRDQFELPEVHDGSNMRWQWAEGSRWRVDGVPDEAVMTGGGADEEAEWDYDGPGGKMGWVYYDTKWQGGRRGQDGWNRWTRRRKWYRDAELVEAEDDEDVVATEEDASTDATLVSPDHPSDSARATPTPSLPPRPPGLAPTPAVPTVDITTPSPTGDTSRPRHHARTPSALSVHKHSSPSSPAPQDILPSSARDDRNGSSSAAATADDPDAASVLSATSTSPSTSSRSSTTRFFRPPGLRRRVTDAASSVRSIQSTLSAQSGRSSRSRRTSAAAEENGEDDDASAVLDTQARMVALQEGGTKEVGTWGVGDDVRMGLE